jgi:hypothetical protein
MTIIGVNIWLFAAATTLFMWALNKLDTDIKAVGDRVDKIAVRMDGHAARIDQLYTMFIDLVKEKKG